MRRKLPRIVAKLAAVVCVLAALLSLVASYEAERARDIPYPRVAAAHGAAEVARGGAIFRATCESCHRAPNGAHASGAPIADAPAWIGSLHSGNLTAHEGAGIAKVSDASLARTIRYGVSREGRWVPMPAYALSDADLAAVLGFLRSSDPLFQPDARPAPRSRLSLLGTLALFLSGTFTPPEPQHARPAAVARANSVEYGRYLASSVYQCGDCHTPGFDRDKLEGAEAYSGGAEMKGPRGQPLYTANLTMDAETGLGRWTREQFVRAVREGVRPDGTRMSAPMPQFRALDELEVDALLTFLRSLPPQRRELAGRMPSADLAASR